MYLLSMPGGGEWLFILMIPAISLLAVYGLVKFILAIIRADKQKHGGK